MTSRGYCFTIHLHNDQTNEDAPNPLLTELPDGVRYAVWQQERGGNTNRLHYQGYIQFNSPVRMSKVKEILQCNWAHVERQRGSDAQASNYGMKDDTRVDGPWTLGEMSTQGKRYDLLKVVDMVKAKRSFADIANECPVEWIRMNKGIKEYANVINKSSIRLGLEIIVFVGETGTGKTRWCYRNYPDLYRLNLGDKGVTTWWDGYEDNSVVLIDDFAGQIPFTELLNYLDIYPLRGRIKGGFVNLNYRHVIITSNVPWENWYPWITHMQQAALKRRLTSIYSITNASDLPPDRIDRHFENQ